MALPFFPKRTYRVRLKSAGPEVWGKLSNETLHKMALTSSHTDKSFIGQVEPGSFQLITSQIGRGAFCVFEGNFDGRDGTILVRINSAFKFLIGIWYVLVFGGGLAAAIYSGQSIIGPLVGASFLGLIVRLIIRYLAFEGISKSGMRVLRLVLDFEEIEVVG